jgi:hypothetical protein
MVVAVLVLVALGALLWMGFRRELPTAGEAAPTIVIPSAPVITGALDEEALTTVESAPTIAPVVEETATEAPPTAPPAAPTIAPAVSAAVAVPNVQGLTIASATQALLPLGLRIALDQPVFSDSVPLNAVAAQDPPPGSQVSPGETVRVSLSRGASPFAAGAQP